MSQLPAPLRQVKRFEDGGVKCLLFLINIFKIFFWGSTTGVGVDMEGLGNEGIAVHDVKFPKSQ